MSEHWLIVGASSSMARAFVRAVSAEHAAVTVVGRDAADMEAIAADARIRGASSARILICDIARAEDRQRCIDAASLHGTTLNVLLAAGQMPEQSDMDKDPRLAQQMIDATYAGPVLLLQGIAPIFEAQRGGTVVVIGSVAGDRGRRKNFVYGSAKAGLATFAEGLRARFHGTGARVMLVKPGFVDTAMTFGTPGLFLMASPEAIAQAMLNGVKRGRMQLYFPWFWRYIMLIIQHIPAAVMQRLKF